MPRWILVIACTAMVAGQDTGHDPTVDDPPATQPASRPADSHSRLRTPTQADILKKLLALDRRPKPIRPVDPGAASGGEPDATAGFDPEGQPLLLEGTHLAERPGRLVHEAGRAKFVFHVDGSSRAPRTMEILENGLLEAMERQAEAGFDKFIISADVTRYRDRNYLLLRKILRRVSHGNLSP